MFEERKVHNGQIHYNGNAYSAEELQWMHGKAVKIMQSAIFPQSLSVFEAEGLALICHARQVNATGGAPTMSRQVLRAIETQMLRHRSLDGPAALRAYALDEWIGSIELILQQAERHISYGNRHHAMESLLKVGTACVECLEYHLEQDAEQHQPDLEQALAELNRHLPLDINPPVSSFSKEDYKETADPATTESAA